MGKRSRKQHAYHEAHVESVKRRLEAAAIVGVPLPGQRVIHPSGRRNPGDPGIFEMTDGTTYAIARDGSFRRAPAGRRILELP
jgi:hypothetical protein